MMEWIRNTMQSLKGQKPKQMEKEEAEFLPAVLEITETPPSPIGRLMIWTLVLLVVIGIVWSIVGRVDEVAVAPGKLIPTGHVKIIQAEDKGVVKAIHVKDGQKVKQGELLLELDTTFSAADLARVQKQIAYFSLEIDRLQAEKDGRPFMSQSRPGLDSRDIELQQKLYESRLDSYVTKMATAQANVNQSLASLEVARANRSKLAALLEIAVDKEERIASLVKENAVAEFVYLDHKSKRLELQQNLAAQSAELQRLDYALAQSQEAMQNIKAEWDRDIATKLVENRKQLSAYQEEVKKVEEKNRLSRIIAPLDGRVNQLSIHTVGGIVTAAQPLMVVVPEDVTVEVEAFVANKDIGFVHPGQRAEVKVETFSFQKYGTVDAEVLDISPDAIEDKEKGRVYRAVLRLDKDRISVNGKPVYLTPGMSITAEIKIKQKRIIEFFLDPFRKYQSEGLRER